MSISMRLPPFAFLLGVAWILASLQLIAGDWALTAFTMPDADDAMRLVQVREFLAGKGWFDLHETRLAPPTGYDSHWSRLIDTGLSALLLAFRLIWAPDHAERLTIVVWPLLWLLPAIGAISAIAWRLGGRNAGLIALLLAAFSLPAFQQFRPGRIDHHNVQIALALLTVAASVWAGQWRPAAAITGVLSGLALAIGFEGLPFIVVAGAGFAFRFVFDREAASDLRIYGLTVALCTLVAFLVSVGPGRWAHMACDAIAINSTVAAVTGGLALAAIGFFHHSNDWRQRMLVVAGAGAVSLAVFVGLEPRCLGGVFALTDPAIGPAWINHVAEVQSLNRMMHRSLANGLSLVAFPAAALVALLIVGRRRRDAAFLIAAGAFITAAAMTVAIVKVFSYAIWFGLPFVAVALANIRSIVPCAFAALALTPSAVGLGAIGIASAVGSEPIVMTTPERQACVSKDGAVALARLPRGLIVTNELDWAPYLLAFTPHSQLAAPYHRLSSIIVTAHQALAKPPSEARDIVAASHINYIAICGPRGPLGVKGDALELSLWNQLRTARVPEWLEPVTLEGPFTVYRVREDRVSAATW
jgi:hypothetical protein